MRTLASGAPALAARAGGGRFLALVLAAPLLLAVARLLPDEGAGLALRLGAAAVCVLVLPGALVVRALGRPAEPAVAVAAAVAWSLAALFAALALTFAVNGSLTLAIAVLAAIAVGAAVPAARAAAAPRLERSELRATLGVLAAGAILGGLVWWAAPPLVGDAIEHLARARKLAELPELGSVAVTELFRDSGSHPGYAFPLWHGALAVVARLAGVDTAEVVRYLPAFVAPLVLLAGYASGRVLFRHWAGGVAVVCGQLAYYAFPADGVGRFTIATGPATASVLLLVPVIVALFFAYVEEGGRARLLALGAASLALAVVHPTYIAFVAVPLLGFLAVRLLLADDRRVEARRVVAAGAGVLVPACLFFLWLLPIVRSAPSFTPGTSERVRQIEFYAGHLNVDGTTIALRPESITAGGPVAVLVLLLLPLAALAARTRWAAAAVGGTLALLILALVPELFSRFTELVTVPQGRRLPAFIPWGLGFAGAALLLGKLRVAGVALALAAGIALQLAYPGDPTRFLVEGGGPAWPVWVAAIGGSVALIAALPLRNRLPADLATSGWTALAAVAFAVPVAVAGLQDLPRGGTDPEALTPGLVAAIRAEVPVGDVVFSNPETSYRIVAFTPVYVASADEGHVWDREKERIGDSNRFFTWQRLDDADRRALLASYDAGWLVVDRTRPWPREFVATLEPPVYEDERFALYRLP